MYVFTKKLTNLYATTNLFANFLEDTQFLLNLKYKRTNGELIQLRIFMVCLNEEYV